MVVLKAITVSQAMFMAVVAVVVAIIKEMELMELQELFVLPTPLHLLQLLFQLPQLR